MFQNILKNSIRQHRITLSSISNALRHVNRTDISSRTSSSDANLKDDLKIEADLFENSTQKYSPVINSEKLLNQHAKINPIQKSNTRKKKSISKESEPIDDPELGFKFYRGNQHFISILTKVRSCRRHDKERKIIVEGRRLITEALDCNLRLEALIFSQRDQIERIKEKISQAQHAHRSKVFKVSQHELKTWSSLTTPPGLMAVFDKPTEIGLQKQLSKKGITPEMLPITVVCDNIREPNNLGSIIRTCAAIPCSQLIVTRGCCDPWESKALRGGCGGHFRMPIRDEVNWSELYSLIPTESLDDCSVFIAENNVEKLQQESEGKSSDYKELGHIGSHNVVVIGGESHGVSTEAYKFLETCGKGKCLHIPLASGMESLNVVSALTLILYELRYKLIKQAQPSEEEICL